MEMMESGFGQAALWMPSPSSLSPAGTTPGALHPGMPEKASSLCPHIPQLEGARQRPCAL